MIMLSIKTQHDLPSYLMQQGVVMVSSANGIDTYVVMQGASYLLTNYLTSLVRKKVITAWWTTSTMRKLPYKLPSKSKGYKVKREPLDY